MQKITIKELVNFRRRTERTRKNFAFKLKTRELKDKAMKDGGSGDYWITSTSTIYNVFKNDNHDFYDSKIEELFIKYNETDDLRIKNMYQRNSNILSSFKDFDFSDSRPGLALKFEKVPKFYKILTIDVFPLYINPSLLFSYERNGKNELGALWLIPQLNGFLKSELGMFCEVLYRFLIKNYSDKYQISEDFCIAIDTFNAQKVTYKELMNGDFPFLIDKTLSEIKEA